MYTTRISFLFLLLSATLSQAQVVINEIYYRPGTGYPENTALEFIELHNSTASAVDLSGWAITDGVSFAIPAGTSILPGGYIVVAANPGLVQSTYGVSGVLGPWTPGATLANGGEKITLSKPGPSPGSLEDVDSVTYASEGDWAARVRETTFNGWDWTTPANGGNRSLELRNPTLSNDNGQNWAASTAPLGATPGSANSALATNIAPIIQNVNHSPAVPTSAQNVTVSCQVNDETAPQSLAITLLWRDATSAAPGPFQPQAMTGNGLGSFSAVLGAKANLTIVEFYISASDGVNTRTWPAPTNESQNANCQYQVNNEVLTATDSYYFLTLTRPENDAYNGIAGSNPNSDRQFNITLIARRGPETTVRYRSSMRIRGNSSRQYQFKPLRISMPNDDRWDGLSDFVLNPRATHLQYLGLRLFQLAGLPAANSLGVELRRNGTESTTSAGGTPDFGKWVRVEEMNSDFVNRQWPLADTGNIYKKVDDGNPLNRYWRSTGWTVPTDPNVSYVGMDGWSKQTNGSANDWTDLTLFFQTWQNAAAPHFPGAPVGDVSNTPANGGRLTGIGLWNGTAFTPAELTSVGNVSDLSQWARFLAVMTIIQDAETKVSNGVDDDYSVYFLPSTGGQRKLQFLPHDLDTIFGLGDTQQDPDERGLYDATDDNQVFRTLLPLLGNNTTAGNATFRTMYHNAIRELYGTVFNADTTGNPNPPFHQFVDNHLTGWAPAATITAIKNFATQRQTYLMGLLGGTTTTPPSATSTATVVSEHGDLVISEVLPHNLSAVNVGGKYPDIIEIQNTGVSSRNLAGMTLSDDPALPKYTFPAGVTLATGARLLLYADGSSEPGHVPFSIENEGERLYLRDSGGVLLDSVTFGPVPPNYTVGRTDSLLETWTLCTPTLGAANVAVSTFASPGGVRINEWLGNRDFRFDDDFLELYNPAAQPAAIGGMSLTDDFGNLPTQHVLPALSFIGPGSYVLFKTKGSAANPAHPGELPFNIDGTFGWLAFIGQNGTIVDRVDINGQAPDASTSRNPDGAGAYASFGTPQNVPTNLPTPGFANANPPAAILALINQLRVSEILFKPTNLEYIELVNIGASAIDLSGVSFARGITYTFPAGTTLGPGNFLVICRDRTAFQTQFGPGVPLAPGVFAGALDNAGEAIAIQPPAPWDAYILNFSYDPSWYPAANAATNNSSLTVLDAVSTAPRDWNDPFAWTASTAAYGTPGNDGPPIINSPLTASTVTGDAFSYTITALKLPTGYGAASLPNGLSINTNTGVISGTAPAAGSYSINISASNGVGSDNETLLLTVASSGPLDAFAWSTIGGTQSAGQPFVATLTATDAQGRANTSFSGNVNVRGQGPGTTAAIVLITECGTGNTDYFEIQNVGNITANTAGWFIVPNNAGGFGGGGGLNVFHQPWALPATIAPGQVIAVTENSAGIYPTAINWNSGFGGLNTWCMLCDNTGAVRDFIAWGYTGTDVTNINLTNVVVGTTTYPSITVPAAQWSGNGAATNQAVKSRGGTADANTSANWTVGNSDANRGLLNTGLTVPFVPPPPAVATTPATVALVNGVWTGNITVTQLYTGMRLSADDGANHTGLSNTFNSVPPPAPTIISPATTRAVAGKNFSYQILGSNSPTSFGATGLPSGLNVNTSTGVISGMPTAYGITNVNITATNLGGTGNLSLSLEVQADADSDGMGDAWEASYGLSSAVNDADGDVDGDGMSNLAEWLAATSPVDPSSRFTITNVQIIGTNVVITWNASIGKRYRIQTRNVLGPGLWSDLVATPIAATSTSATFTHVGGVSGAQRFYRVAVEP